MKNYEEKDEMFMQVLLLLNLIIPFVLNLIFPFVMVLVGAILKKHPVSDMGSQNGYNTPTSRKSQAHWDYAQKIAPDIYISLGKYLFIVEIITSVILLMLEVSTQISVVVGMLIGIVFMYYGFFHTDRQIREEFGDKQKG